MTSQIPKHDDPACIGAESVFRDTPEIGALGEVLSVDEDGGALEARFDPERCDDLFQLYRTAAHLPDFESNPPAATRHAVELGEYARHLARPAFYLARHGDAAAYRFGIQAV